MSAHERVGDVLASGLPDVWQFAVLIVLAHHCNQSEGLSWPSVDTICKATGMSERRAQYALRQLEAAGLIQPIGSRKGGRGQSVKYQLRLPSVAAKGARRAPNHPRKGCTDAAKRVHGWPVKGAHGAPEPLNRKEQAPTRLRASHSQDSPREKIWTLGVTILTSSGRTESAARALLGKWIRDHGEEAVAGALGAAATRADPAAYLAGILRRRNRSAGGVELLLTPEEERAARGRPQ